jgi:hypothetical protein
MSRPKPSYPHIWAAVEAAGKNDPERAKAIGVGVRTIMRWRKGEWPDCFEYFTNHPPLHEAMGLEIAARGPATTDTFGT